VDPSYFKTLSWMLENDITDVLDLTFTEEVDYFGRVEVKELKPGGRDVKAGCSSVLLRSSDCQDVCKCFLVAMGRRTEWDPEPSTWSDSVHMIAMDFSSAAGRIWLSTLRLPHCRSCSSESHSQVLHEEAGGTQTNPARRGFVAS